jgi:predicted nucleotidyltransferase
MPICDPRQSFSGMWQGAAAICVAGCPAFRTSIASREVLASRWANAAAPPPALLLDLTTFVVFYDLMLDLRSKARQRLLAYYFTNPVARHHLRDLAARLSIDPSNLSRELRRLEREGLFRSEVSGCQKYFQLNREYPLFREVRSIIAKTVGAAPLIKQSVKRIEGIEEAYLYGSFARNQEDASSDIDVLVIGTPRGDALVEAMGKLERQLGRDINYTVLSRAEFDSRRARKDAFLESVWHNRRVSLIAPHEKAQAT